MSARRSAGKAFKSFLGGFLAVVLVVVAWLWLPTTVRYRITESYSFQASAADSKVFLGIMLPKTGPYQRVENLTVAWEGHQSQEELPEVDVIKFNGGVHRAETKQAVIAYDVVLWQGRARWDGPVEPWQMLPQQDIESDASVFVEKAAELTKGQSRDDAFRVFGFAAGSLSWPKGSRTTIGEARQSALKAYETGEGVCGEFANLTVALSRAAKIPSKSISGLSLPPYPPHWSSSRTWSHPGGSHAWVEVHTEAGWEMADPSAASMIPWRSLWFGRNDGCHLSYGEAGGNERTYSEMTTWASSNGTIIGAMSAPIKFVAAASASGVSVKPEVTVRMGHSDWRWFALAAFVVMSIVLQIIKRVRAALPRAESPENAQSRISR